MDVDNDPVDQNLLLQFTCLGTTDRDELVKQFKELIDKVSDHVASFYLEMHNWNLQNAIWAYLDHTVIRNKFGMSLVQTSNVGCVAPDADLHLSWTIRNTGNVAWNSDLYIRWIEGNFFCNCQSLALKYTQFVPPDDVVDISVKIITPSSPGWYYSSWRLISPQGIDFGDVLKCTFQVYDKLEEKEEQCLSEELASRMILVEGAGNKTMEEEVLNESAGCVLDNFSSSKDINKTDAPNIDQEDQNTS